MVDEGHVLYILGKLEKFQKNNEYIDCSIKSNNGNVGCHQVLLSSVCKLNGKKHAKPIDEKEASCSFHVATSYKDVIKFLSLLYNPTINVLEDEVKDLLCTSKLFGINLGCQKNGSRKTASFHEQFTKQRNEAFGQHLVKMKIDKFVSDIVLIIEKQKFFCHRVILASFSGYFGAMFTTNLKELHQSEVDIHCVDKSVFKLILDFMYTGENIISIENIQQVLLASSYLQIQVLQSQCERFMIRHIEIDNTVDIANLGDTVGSEYLTSKAVHFISQHFSKVCRREEFLTLSKDIFVRILKCSQINVENEYKILQVVLSWVKHQKVDVKISDIIVQNIRLTLILDTELKETLDDPAIRSDEKCVQHITDAMKNKLKTFEQNRAFETEEVMTVIWSSCYSPGLNLACYSFVSKCWYQMPCLPEYNTGCSYGACSDERDLYICGGTGDPTAFFQFNFPLNKWKKLGPIEFKYGRADHGMVMEGENIYLVGGSLDQISILPYVDRYNTKTRCLDRIGALSIPVSNPSCAIFVDSIIVFGGNKSLGEYVSSIQRFDLSTNSCTSFSKLPIMCSYSGLVVNEDVIYIVGPRGDIVYYEHGKNPVVLGSIHKQTIFGFGTVYNKGKVYILGGKSDRFESTEVRCFDVNSKATVFTNRNMKIPAKKESNQYYGSMQHIRKSILVLENVCLAS